MTSSQQRADDLQDRLIDLAVRIIKLADALPKTSAGAHIANQVLRSGTSPAPNYGEARGGESRSDFKHKLGIVLKELNETAIWLKVIQRSKIVKPALVDSLLDETQQLARIITASVKTVRAARPMENGKRQMENGK
ncbi:MAG: four helix bundle protein [Planctomycetes bacterium]|nr:four helix bundle protein [Planctomycetota bacterium]